MEPPEVRIEIEPADDFDIEEVEDPEMRKRRKSKRRNSCEFIDNDIWLLLIAPWQCAQMCIPHSVVHIYIWPETE